MEQPSNDTGNDEYGEEEEWLEPAFLNPDDVVEVVEDENGTVPMDDDDEDEDGTADNGAEDLDTAESNNNNTSAPDTSILQIQSHTGPVYSVASTTTTTAQLLESSLVVVSGGGDDRAFLHRIVAGTDAAALPSGESASVDGMATPVVASSSTLLSHAHTDTVSCVAFSPPSSSCNQEESSSPTSMRLLAVGGFDGAIVLYDAETGALVCNLEGPTDVEWLTFHKSGTILLVGSSSDGTVWMYHVVVGRSSNNPHPTCLQVFVGHAGTVTAGGFTPDGKWAVTAGADGSLRVWAPKTGVAKHTVSFANAATTSDDDDMPAAGLTCLAFGTMDTTTSKLVIVGSEDGQAHVVHTVTGKILHSLRHFEAPMTTQQQETDEDIDLPMSVEAVSFCPHNPLWCATGGVDGVLKIWDLTGGQVRQVCRVEQHIDTSNSKEPSTLSGGITQLAWHTSLPVVFTSTTTGVVRLWDARNGALLDTLSTGNNLMTINAMDVVFVSESKTLIVTAGDDNVVRLFSVNVPHLLSARQ